MIAIFLLGVFLIIFFTASYSMNTEAFLMITLPFLILELLGIIFVYKKPLLKVGKVCYTIGMIMFLPISLVGFFGMKSYIEKAEDAEMLKDKNEI